MEGKIIIFLLLSTVTSTMSQELGDPMIILNSTTDYAAQTRSIHVSWLLNSMPPGDILVKNRTRRVLSCEASIDCENGYTFRTENCKDDTLRDGWNFNNIPLNEKSCNVTVRYNDKLDFKGNIYDSTELCSFPDVIGTTVDVHGTMENLTVGDPYKIHCEVYTDQIVHSDIVNITWIGPNDDTIVPDNRTSITTNSTGHNHTSTLQFSYLSEDDEGLFTCHVTILSNTDSESFEIKEISIPTPYVSVTVLNNQTVGSELSLKCDVATVRGLTSNVEIVWMTSGTAVGELNDSRISISPTKSSGSIHTSTLQFSYLSEDDDGSVYICNVVIHDIDTSISVELNNFHIPPPTVRVTALNQDNDNPLSLRCDVDIVKGITSTVDIVWKMNNTEVQRENGNITEEETSYTYYYTNDMKLNTNNDVICQCQVIINTSPLISNTDDITIYAVPSVAPTTLSSESTSPGAAVIAVISIIIAMSVFMALGIFIGICTYRNKKNKIKQWTRDEDIKYLPPTEDNAYSAIGKDAASTCESLGSDNHKLTEWIKNTQMPAIDEECDSISIDPMEINEQQMLEHVLGFNTVKKTRIDKFSVSTADSGIDTELYNDVNKGLQPQIGLYISHQAAEDMHNATTTDPGETEQPSPQEGTNSQTTSNPINSSSSQSDDNSTLLSMFYNTLVKQNSNSNEPAAASANGFCASSLTEGSNNDHTVASNYKIINQSSSYVPITTTVKEGTNQPLFHSVNNNDSANSISHVMPSSSENVSQPLVHSTCTGTTMTAKDGSYVDHYVASNTDQPSPHPTHSNTITSAKDGSYVDHYAVSNIDQSMSHPKPFVTIKHENHTECNATSNVIHPTSQPAYNDTVSTGSYVDYCGTSNATQPQLPYYKIATAEDESYVDHYAASNTDQPSSHPTHSDTITPANNGNYVDHYAADQPLSHPTQSNMVLTGSYIDRYALSNAKHPSPYFTYTKPVVNVDHVGNYTVPNTDHPTSQPTYNGTISGKSYIGCYIASDTSSECHVDHNATLNSNHPIYLKHVDAVSFGSKTAKDGNNVDQYAVSSSNHPASFPTYTDTLSTGSYVDCYTASNSNDKSFHSFNGATLPTAVGTSYAVHSGSANTNTFAKPLVCIDTSAEGIYIDNSTLFNNDRPQSDVPATVIKGGHIDHCITSNADQTLTDSTDSTSTTGIYVDCYMASNSDSKLASAKAADSKASNIKSSSEKEKPSCNSSFTVERDSCPSPITGVYLPYTTAMEENTANNATPNSTVNKASTANQAKRKPGDLFLPSGNKFSYNLLNESTPTPTFGSLSANDCETPNVGEYIAHDNLDYLGMTNHYNPKIEGNHSVSLPVAPYSTSSHSTANSGYFDYRTAIQQGSASAVSSAQPHMQQNTNVLTSMPFSSVALMQNVNGYMTESDI